MIVLLYENTDFFDTWISTCWLIETQRAQRRREGRGRRG